MRINWTVVEGDGGRLKIQFSEDDQKRYVRYVSRAWLGTVLAIDLERLFASRSVPQNRYYWWCVVEPLRQYLGIESAELMHEVLKHEHLSTSVRVAFDRRKRIRIPKSTTELSTLEFETYLDSIRRWARRFARFEIPLPNNSPYPYDPNEWTTNPSTSSP